MESQIYAGITISLRNFFTDFNAGDGVTDSFDFWIGDDAKQNLQ